GHACELPPRPSRLRLADPALHRPDAEFVFVDDPDDVPDDATPFDIRGAELSHHNGNCSFETFLERYDVDDTALHELARIVHEADLPTTATTHPRPPASTGSSADSATRTPDPELFAHRADLRRPLRHQPKAPELPATDPERNGTAVSRPSRHA